MYKVILLDDEPWSLKGISQVFNWATTGFEVALMTTDAHEVLDKLCTDKIDVVFTDVRMPELSGLELMNAAREKGVDSEFVFISGFAEFQYVQQALKEGAFDYFLKPIPPEEAITLLNKLRNHLDNKRINSDTQSYEALLESRISISELFLSRKLKFSGSYFSVYSVLFYDNKPEDLLKLLKTYHTTIELYLGSGKYIFLCCIPENAKDLTKEIDGLIALDIGFSLGISSISKNPENFTQLLKEAEIALFERFVTRKSGVYNYLNSNYSPVKSFLSNLYGAFETSDLSSIESLTNEIPSLFQNSRLGIQEAAFFWNQVVAYFTGKSEDLYNAEELGFLDTNQLFDKFGDIYNLSQHIRYIITSTTQKDMEQSIPPDATSSFKELITFINGNYTKELYLKELAERFHIGFTYTSALFKKYLNKTFSEYVSDLRMKKAQQLLSSTSITIEEICSKVGYNDYYYFNRIFKKCFGMPPHKYRKSIR